MPREPLKNISEKRGSGHIFQIIIIFFFKEKTIIDIAYYFHYAPTMRPPWHSRLLLYL